jgi:hypothetical protein
MRAPARLSIYGAFLIALFIGAWAVAGAVVPDSTVQEWNRTTETADVHGDGEPAADVEHDGDH